MGVAGAHRAVCLIGFLWMVMLIRFFGKRTISKMNPSDFVITVAVGSPRAVRPKVPASFHDSVDPLLHLGPDLPVQRLIVSRAGDENEPLRSGERREYPL